MCSLLHNTPYFGFCCRHKGAVAVRQPYIRVVGIEETNETDSRSPANFTADEVSNLHVKKVNVVYRRKFAL